MGGPLIAVVGDAGTCSDPKLARDATRAIGAELARSGCRLLVFSSMKEFVEWEAVLGYMEAVKKVKGPPPEHAIEVRYPPKLDGRFEGEKANDPLFKRQPQVGDWEAAMYPAFASVDGLVLIGGNNTVRLWGLLALGARKPMLLLAGMGGAAGEVWRHVKGDRNAVASQADLDLMINKDWGAGSARQHVDSLLGQRQRLLEAERLGQETAAQRKLQEGLGRLTLIAAALFALMLVGLVAALLPVEGRLPLLVLLFATPAVAGTSAAAIRVVWEHWKHADRSIELQPLRMTLALGFFAGGVAGALYVAPQLITLGSGADPAAWAKLAAFAAPAGLLAGLSLETFFPRLITKANSDPLTGTKAPAAGGAKGGRGGKS